MNGSHTTDCSIKIVNKSDTRGSIFEELEAFASSVPDFRRRDKGHLRHRLADIIMLIILSRASGCVGRADIIQFGRHNLNKIRSIEMLENGVPSESTLFRIENGIETLDMAEKMQDFAGLFHSEL